MSELAHAPTPTEAAPLVFHTVEGTRPALTRRALSWPEMARQLTKHRERDDKNGRGFILADFTEPHRNAANLASYAALCLDLDTHADPEAGEIHEPPPPEEAAERLRAAGLAGVIFTTHNHEAPPELNKGKPSGARYRLVLPLAEPIEPGDLESWTRRAAALLDLAGDYLDPASWRPAQFFYAPSCRPGAPRYAVATEGRPLSAADLEAVELPALELPQAANDPQPTAPARMPSAPAGQPARGFDATKAAARGHWPHILARLGIDAPAHARKHGPCPGCGGRDRFRFDDLDGHGTFICSQGGAGTISGDGFNLVQHVKGCTEGDALRMVRDALGMDTSTTRPANDNAPARDEARRRQQQEENARIQQAGEEVDTRPPILAVDEMLRDYVWVNAGEQVAHRHNRHFCLSWKEFRSFTAASITVDEPDHPQGKPRAIPNAVIWQRDPDRATVDTRTFHAGAPVICRDPDGRPAVNTWRPIARQPGRADIAPFLDHVAYLFPDETERGAFLDWLAHLEQKPGELPHYGWLHVANNTGTGRNWLASLLARVWRGYVAPNVDLPALLDSQFNGPLAGRLLAVVDEVQEAGGDNPYRHTNKLKSLVNAEYRDVNPKYGRMHREHNACRWLVFSNHLNALPINDTDRRWRVIHHTAAPRPPEVYARLYAALADPEFVNAVAAFLAARDIGRFNPGERPPMSDAKRAVVGAAKSMIQKNAEEIAAHWPADIITNNDAAQILSEGEEASFTPAMRRALEELGAIRVDRQIKVNGRPLRCWIIRNPAAWLAADSASMAAEVRRARATTPDAETAALVLARGGESRAT